MNDQTTTDRTSLKEAAQPVDSRIINREMIHKGANFPYGRMIQMGNPSTSKKVTLMATQKVVTVFAQRDQKTDKETGVVTQSGPQNSVDGKDHTGGFLIMRVDGENSPSTADGAVNPPSRKDVHDLVDQLINSHFKMATEKKFKGTIGTKSVDVELKNFMGTTEQDFINLVYKAVNNGWSTTTAAACQDALNEVWKLDGKRGKSVSTDVDSAIGF